MDQIIQTLISFWGSGLIVFLIFICFISIRYLFNRTGQDNQKSIIAHQVINGILILSGALAFVISLPIEQSIRSQIISLIGIVLSAAFALSSTTLIGNAFYNKLLTECECYGSFTPCRY